MKKCDYCAKEISYHEQFCSDECQIKANKYYEKEEKFGKLFMVVNIICVFGIPVGLFVSSASNLVGTLIAAFSCWIIGIMLILLPFTVESMMKKHKLKKAIKFTRIFGIIVFLFGFVIFGLQKFVFN